MFYGLKKQWRLLAAGLVFLAANGAVILPWYMKPQDSEIEFGPQVIRVMLANVHSANNDYARLLELIKSESPDIIVLEEVTKQWKRGVKQLFQDYEYNLFHPRQDNFGIALFSRIKLQDVEVVRFTQSETPSIVATVKAADAAFTLIATHALPPVGVNYFSLRNRQLDKIARYVKEQTRPCLVIGDLNCTMWSYYHDKFLTDSNLRNTRRGFGVRPTWPTLLPFLYIPLDHCMVGDAFNVLDFRTANRIGSDHLPVIVDLALENQ